MSTQAVAVLEPQFVMVAKTEQGYLEIAHKIAKAGLLPKGMTLEQAAIAMMSGGEYGLSPLQSINGFAVINGRATPFGTTLRAICEGPDFLGSMIGCIRGVGEMKYVATEEPFGDGLGVEMMVALRSATRRRLARLGWTLEGDKWVAEAKAEVPPTYRCGYAVLKRKGRPVQVDLFDSIEAQTAGLLSRSGPWSQFPEKMFEARASTFALRKQYPDKLAGLDLTAEEAEHIDGPAAEVKPPVASAVLDELVATPRPAVRAEHPPATPAPGQVPIEAEFTEKPKPSKAGSEALSAIAKRIKDEGGDVAAMHPTACERALGAVKPSARMTDEEKGKVAAELATQWECKRVLAIAATLPRDGGEK